MKKLALGWTGVTIFDGGVNSISKSFHFPKESIYRANPSIRNWHHEKYHLLSLKIRERVGPKSALIS